MQRATVGSTFTSWCVCVFAGDPIPQPGGLQPCREVRQQDGGHPAEAASGEAPVQPRVVRHPQQDPSHQT